MKYYCLFFLILADFLISKIERYFHARLIIKYQTIEITSDGITTKNSKKSNIFIVTKKKFKLGRIIRKNEEVISIGVRYNYAPCDIKLRGYENMDKLLECLEKIKQ